jgi:hypothetical protein
MFEKSLADKFQKIFEVARVTYDQPAPDDREQDVLFVEVHDSKNQIKDGKAQAKVTGKAFMFSESSKLPFGYFSKAIKEHAADTKDLFFYEIEENTKLHQNIQQRGFSFIYFFNSQYDPDLGTLNSLELDIEVTE